MQRRSQQRWGCDVTSFTETEFIQTFRMSRSTFDYIHQKLPLRLLWKDTWLRQPILLCPQSAISFNMLSNAGCSLKVCLYSSVTPYAHLVHHCPSSWLAPLQLSSILQSSRLAQAAQNYEMLIESDVKVVSNLPSLFTMWLHWKNVNWAWFRTTYGSGLNLVWKIRYGQDFSVHTTLKKKKPWSLKPPKKSNLGHFDLQSEIHLGLTHCHPSPVFVCRMYLVS